MLSTLLTSRNSPFEEREELSINIELRFIQYIFDIVEKRYLKWLIHSILIHWLSAVDQHQNDGCRQTNQPDECYLGGDTNFTWIWWKNAGKNHSPANFDGNIEYPTPVNHGGISDNCPPQPFALGKYRDATRGQQSNNWWDSTIAYTKQGASRPQQGTHYWKLLFSDIIREKGSRKPASSTKNRGEWYQAAQRERERDASFKRKG